mmetsp:Transcript_28311/g.27241  ORF Transcript_28311/g.27241 Transcript_28311/m.27241 type:complete len:97 (-) Transcript_28311:205-495(-)
MRHTEVIVHFPNHLLFSKLWSPQLLGFELSEEMLFFGCYLPQVLSELFIVEWATQFHKDGLSGLIYHLVLPINLLREPLCLKLFFMLLHLLGESLR